MTPLGIDLYMNGGIIITSRPAKYHKTAKIKQSNFTQINSQRYNYAGSTTKGLISIDGTFLGHPVQGESKN